MLKVVSSGKRLNVRICCTGGCFQKEHLLEKVEKAFQLGLCHPLSWVRWYSVLAFTTFAQHTVHASVIPRCLGTDASSQAYVTAYLQKVRSVFSHVFCIVCCIMSTFLSMPLLY